jgi:hypothetical protein
VAQGSTWNWLHLCLRAVKKTCLWYKHFELASDKWHTFCRTLDIFNRLYHKSSLQIWLFIKWNCKGVKTGLCHVCGCLRHLFHFDSLSIKHYHKLETSHPFWTLQLSYSIVCYFCVSSEYLQFSCYWFTNCMTWVWSLTGTFSLCCRIQKSIILNPTGAHGSFQGGKTAWGQS